MLKGLNVPRALEARRNMPDKRREELCGYAYQSNKIPELFTPYFWTCVGIWKRWKMLGLPYAGGWAEQPAHLIHVIELFEGMHQTEQNKEAEKSGNIRRAKTNRKG